MRETKVQKIARLEKKIEEQKKEMTEIKKDRKRLNYAVERLEREKKKALETLTPAAINLICEYSDQVAEKERKNETLKAIINEKENVIADKENRYNNLLSAFNEKRDDENAIREKIWGDKKEFEASVMTYTVQKIVTYWDGIYRQSWDDKKQLKYFNDGRRYWDYYDDDGDEINTRAHLELCSMFSTTHLIIGINPDNGRELSGIDKYAIQYYLKTNDKTKKIYSVAIKELEEFKENNPNVANEELVEWAYHKGMELLPLYRDKIF